VLEWTSGHAFYRRHHGPLPAKFGNDSTTSQYSYGLKIGLSARVLMPTQWCVPSRTKDRIETASIPAVQSMHSIGPVEETSSVAAGIG
jgi:hypothetical protein